MKKRLLSIALSISMIAALLCDPMTASAHSIEASSIVAEEQIVDGSSEETMESNSMETNEETNVETNVETIAETIVESIAEESSQETESGMLESETALEETMESVAILPEEDDLGTTGTGGGIIPTEEYTEDSVLLLPTLPYREQRVLLIQDNLPWSRVNSDIDVNQTVLKGLTNYSVTSTLKFTSLDLSSYSVIIFANDQTTSSYSIYARIKDKMSAFASDGGVIVFGAADGGWASGTLSASLPGGASKVSSASTSNTIVDSKHPIVTGSLTDGTALTNNDLRNNYCSHVYFTNLPSGSSVILKDSNSNPTLVEYPFGKGKIILSGLTWEHAYRNAGTNISGITCGDFAIKALDDLYAYALESSKSAGRVSEKIAPNQHLVMVCNGGNYNSNNYDPIEGATVTIGTQKATTNKEGKAWLEDVSGKKYVTVSAPGYYTKKYYYEVQGGHARYFMLNKVTPGTAALAAAYGKDIYNGTETEYDLTLESLHTKKKHSYEIRLEGDFNENEPGTFALTDGSKTAYSVNGTFTMDSDGKCSNTNGEPVTFQAGQISAFVITKDGKKSAKTKLNFYVRAAAEVEFFGEGNEGKFSLGKTVGVTMPESAGILGGMDLNFAFDLLPFTYEQTEDEIKIAIGVNKSDIDNYAKLHRAQNGLDPNNKNALSSVWNDYKKKFDDCKKTKNLYNLSKAFGGKGGKFTSIEGFDTDYGAMGYMTGKFNADTGEITNIEGALIITGSGGASTTTQMVIGVVPVYFTLSGSITISNETKIKYLIAESNSLVVDDTLTITPEFKLGGGVGIKGALSAGGTGTASLPIIPVSYVDGKTFTAIDLSAELSVNASIAFVFSAEKSLAKGTWHLLRYNWGSDKIEWLDNIASSDLDLLDENSYRLMDRSYQSDDFGWYTEGVQTQALVDGMQTLKSGIMPTSNLQLTKLNDGRWMVIFQDDDATRSSINRSCLMYSIYDNGIWSAPKAVWDNGYADMAATIKTNSFGTYVAWQKANKSLSDDSSLTDVAAATEIAIAKFDTAKDSFVDTAYVTNNATVEMIPSLAVGKNNAYVIWESNSENQLLGGGTNTVTAYDINTKMTETLYSGSSSVTTMDAKYDTSLKVAITLDQDADFNSIEDTDVFYWNGSSLSNINQDSVGQVNAHFAEDGKLYWYQDSERAIFQYDGNSISLYAQNDDLGSNFSILSNGSKVAVGWLGVDHDMKYCYQAVVDNGNGWSETVDILSSSANLECAVADLDAAGNWMILSKATTADNSSVLLFNGVKPYISTTVNNLLLKERTVYDNKYALDCSITNHSEQTIDTFVLVIQDEEGTPVYTDQIHTTVLGGETKNISSEVDLPIQLSPATYQVYVYADGENNIEDNSKESMIGYTDLEVTLDHYHSDETEIFTVDVYNNSEIPADATLTIKDDTVENGHIRDTISLGEVSKNSSASHTMIINPRDFDFDGQASKTIYFVVESTMEESYLENNVASCVIENPDYLAPDAEANVEKIELTVPDPIQLSLDQVPNYSLNPNVIGSGVRNWPLTYTVADSTIATVDEYGLIQAKAPGTTTVTVTADGTDISATANISVSLMTGTSLQLALTEVGNKTTGYQVGDVYDFSIRTDKSGSDLPNDLFTITSSNTTVANILEDGKLSCLTPGNTTIKAVLKEDPVKSVSLDIQVTEAKCGKIEISYQKKDSSTVYTDNFIDTTPSLFAKNATPITLSAVCYAENGQKMPNATVSYRSNNASIATINGSGLVKSTGKQGTAIITATCDGAVSEFKIYVYTNHKPVLLSGEKVTLNRAKPNSTTIQVQPIGNTKINSVGSYLYTGTKQKNGTMKYSSDSSISVSKLAAEDTSICSLNLKVSSYYSGAKKVKRYLYVTTNGETYYLPLTITITNTVPKAKITTTGYNAFFKDANGTITAECADATISSISVVSNRSNKKISSGFTFNGTGNMKEYSNNSTLNRHLSNGGKISDCNLSYKVYVYYTDYDIPYETTVKLPVKYAPCKINLATKTLTSYKTNSYVVLSDISYRVSGENENRMFTYSPISSTTSKAYSVSWNNAQPDKLQFVVKADLAKKSKETISFKLQNWVAAISVPLTVNPAQKTISYKCKSNANINVATHSTDYLTVIEAKGANVPLYKNYTLLQNELFTVTQDNTGKIKVTPNQSMDQYKQNSYSYEIQPKLQTGEEINPISLKIKVSKKVPNIVPSTKTVYLDITNLGHSAKVSFSQSFKSNSKIQVLSDNKEVNDLFVKIQNNTLTISSKLDQEGVYQLIISPEFEGGCRAKNITLKVITHKNSQITTKVSGAVSPVGQGKKATIRFSVQNNSAGMKKIELSNAFSSQFEIASFTKKNNTEATVTLKAKEGIYITGGTNTVPFDVTLNDNRKVLVNAEVKSTSSALKVNKSQVTLCLSGKDSSIATTLSLNNNQVAFIETVTPVKDSELRITDNGSGQITITPKSLGSLKAGKTYTIPCKVTVRLSGHTDPVTLKTNLSIKVIK